MADVRGKSLLDLLWEQLDEFVDDVQQNGQQPGEDADGLVSATEMQEWAEARGRAHAAAVCVALVTNPYHPDVDAIKAEAMDRWSDRYEAQQAHEEKPTLVDKIKRRAARRARREAARNR